MWGFWSALLSGALMSIQGVFNTNVTKQTSLVGFNRLGTVFCVSGLRVGVDFYRGGTVLARCGRWRINILYLAVLSEHLLQ